MGHEEELCELLIDLLEEEYGTSRTDVTCPERDGSGPPVEIRLRIGDHHIAIEHTLVEPFPRALQTGKEFVELTNDIVKRLHGRMPPPGIYTLFFPIHPTAAHHRRRHAQVRQRIVE